jgi:hypothetical protein
VKNIKHDCLRHWFQLVCVASGSAVSLCIEASRKGWFYGEQFGFSAVLHVLFFIHEASFYVSCLEVHEVLAKRGQRHARHGLRAQW